MSTAIPADGIALEMRDAGSLALATENGGPPYYGYYQNLDFDIVEVIFHDARFIVGSNGGSSNGTVVASQTGLTSLAATAWTTLDGDHMVRYPDWSSTRLGIEIKLTLRSALCSLETTQTIASLSRTQQVTTSGHRSTTSAIRPSVNMGKWLRAAIPPCPG